MPDPRVYMIVLRSLQRTYPGKSDAERAALASMIVGAGDATLANANTVAFTDAVKSYLPELPQTFTHSREEAEQDRRATARQRLSTMPMTTEQQKIARAMEAERLALESQAADEAIRTTDGPRSDVRDVIRSFASNGDREKIARAMEAEQRAKEALKGNGQ